MTSKVFLREVTWLPSHIRGFTQETEDGNYNVCINSNLSEEQKRKTLNHELRHIKGEDFRKEESVAKIEEDVGCHQRLP